MFYSPTFEASLFSPPTTRRFTVEVFEPASTRLDRKEGFVARELQLSLNSIERGFTSLAVVHHQSSVLH
jgi:hypothetical protein